MTKKQIVIVGGGFAGISAALKLANRRGVAVKLVSDRSFFEYRPSLYRSATGRSPLEVAIPLRDFFGFAKNIEVIKDKITQLDSNAKTVTAEFGACYQYDELILALGAVTAYFGVKGLEEHSFGVKSIHEALELKRHIHQQLMLDKPDRHYVVVGAGATGVELSAEMVGYIQTVYEKHDISHRATVNLIEAAPRAMPALPEDMSKRIDRRLTELGVKTFYDTAVQSETAASLELADGSIKSRTVVWTAGVTNNSFYLQFPDLFKFGRGGRVEVDEFFEASPNIYVLGDSANSEYSGMAQTAMRGGKFVAKNILRARLNKAPKPHKAKRPVYATPVGPGWAAVLWGKFRFYGRSGSTLRALADIRFYFTTLPIRKAMAALRYGQTDTEACPVCQPDN